MLERLKDKAFRYAVFQIMQNECQTSKENMCNLTRFESQPQTLKFSFDKVTSLFLCSPLSLEDLRFFPNLQSLCICFSYIEDYQPLLQAKKLEKITLHSYLREDREKVEALHLNIETEFINELCNIRMEHRWLKHS